jgi:glycosyltransferase involved in cell wall biosynthesis
MRAREEALVRMGVPLILSAPQPAGQEKPDTYLVRSPYDYPLATDFAPRRPVILFLGRLTYEANVDGLMWFVENCWEGIRRRHPDALLRIVGTEPPAAVRALAGRGNVEIHANVADVDIHYADAAVAIVPVRRGTGVQMKLIQALAAGVPTVATTAVVSRAGVRHGVDVIQADTPQAWVDGVSRLLTDSATALRLSSNGRVWAKTNHSWEAVEEQLATAYKSVTR